jgi:ABC-type transport system substrate-binding protein
VRRAVSYAVDVDRILTLTRGFGVVAQQIIPPLMPWSNPGLHRHEYDPEKARQLLRDAGLPDGFKTQLWYQIDPPIIARLAQGIQQDLHRVGIEAQLNGVNSETFIVKSGSRHQVPCGVSGWYEDYPDPSDYLDVMLNGERITDSDCNNLAFYNNPQVTALLNRANSSMDAALRTQLFRDAEVMVMRDAPWVPILHEQMPRLNNPHLHGIEPHPVWLWRYERMWFDN